MGEEETKGYEINSLNNSGTEGAGDFCSFVPSIKGRKGIGSCKARAGMGDRIALYLVVEKSFVSHYVAI